MSGIASVVIMIVFSCMAVGCVETQPVAEKDVPTQKSQTVVAPTPNRGKKEMNYTSAEVEVVAGDLANRKKRIDDKKELRQLLSFFPELGSGKRSSELNPWKHAVILRFVKRDGTVVKVATNHDLFEGRRKSNIYFWSEGKGDWLIENPDAFRTYIRKLLKEKPKPANGDEQ